MAGLDHDLEAGDRVMVTDPGSEYCGAFGTVTVGEYRAVLTGRMMVDVHIDDTANWDDEGFYVSEVEWVRPRIVAA